MKLTEKSSTIGGLWTEILFKLKPEESDQQSDSIITLVKSQEMTTKLNHLKQIVEYLPWKSLPRNACDGGELAENVSYTNLLIKNYFSDDFNTTQDSGIIRRSCALLDTIIPLTKSKEVNLMYNAKPETLDDQKLALAAEVAELLRTLLEDCPTEISSTQWDFLRIALSSWILTISNVLPERHRRLSLNRFMVAVMSLFDSLMKFFETERKKSSTQLLAKVNEEWNSVFAREVNTVLILILHNLLASSRTDDKQKYLLKSILPCFERINFVYLMLSKQVSKNVTQQEFLHSLFQQLSHPVAEIRYSVLRIIHNIIPHLVTADNESLSMGEGKQSEDTNYLNTVVWPLFSDDSFNIHEALVDFQFRVSDVENVPPLAQDKCIAYLYLWNVVLDVCSKSKAELRAFYAKWIASRGLEGMLLRAVFRLLPIDVIRNFETKSSMIDAYFNGAKGLTICGKREIQIINFAVKKYFQIYLFANGTILNCR